MTKKIAIIGAGISGLSLGYYLSKKNFNVTIFEQEKDVGGLLGSIEIDKNIMVEKFYHHIFSFDKEFLELFSELGLSKNMVWYKSSNSVFLDNKFLPFSKVSDYLRFPHLNIFQKIKLLVGGYVFSKKKLSDVEGLKAEYTIKKYMGRKSWNKIWGPLFIKKFGKDAKDISASWFWWRINAKIGEKTKETLGYPKGGFSSFVKLLADRVRDNSGKIVSNIKVEGVIKTNSGYKINGDCFDKVIFTIPNNEINKIYKNAKLMDIKYKSAINLILVLKKQQTNWYWNNILSRDIPFVGIIEHTNLVDNKYYNGRYIIYLTQYLDNEDSMYSKKDSEIYEDYEKYFSKVLINKTDIKKYFVSKSKYAQPIIKDKPTDIGYKKIEQNVYAISMEHVYPEDRGINQAVKYAKILSNKIS